MALHPQPHPPSGTTQLVSRLPAASHALLGRLEHLAYAALSKVRHHLRQSLTSANHGTAGDLHERLPAAANELSRRLGRSPRPSEIATLLDEEVDSVVEVVADDRFAGLESSEDDPGGGSHPVEP